VLIYRRVEKIACHQSQSYPRLDRVLSDTHISREFSRAPLMSFVFSWSTVPSNVIFRRISLMISFAAAWDAMSIKCRTERRDKSLERELLWIEMARGKLVSLCNGPKVVPVGQWCAFLSRLPHDCAVSWGAWMKKQRRGVGREADRRCLADRYLWAVLHMQQRLQRHDWSIWPTDRAC